MYSYDEIGYTRHGHTKIVQNMLFSQDGYHKIEQHEITPVPITSYLDLNAMLNYFCDISDFVERPCCK